MKVALVHDWLTNFGGAERVLLELHKMYPQAPIYTSVYNPEKVPQFKDAEVRTSFIQKLPLARTKHQLFPMLRRKAFELFDFRDFDLVISISGAEAKGIKTPGKTVHINICNSPTHYYWSHYHEYLKNPGLGKLNGLARFVLKATITRSRKWDFKAAQRPDYMLAISTTVQKRIKHYYKRNSTVMFPPTDIEHFSSGKKRHERESYLVVGRQVPYKRIDLVIEACTKLKRQLDVVGDGPEHNKLVAMAGPTVHFHGWAPEAKKVDLYASAKAFVFPNEDDFGLVPVEAMVAGTPVIAFKAGGALDTVSEGKSGLFFEKQTVDSLIAAIKRFETMKFKEKDIQDQAAKFSVPVFRKKLQAFIKDHV
jgi:glycosyltransferase involved in cell wall biosynthesis